MKLKHFIELILSFIIFAYLFSKIYKTPIYNHVVINNGNIIILLLVFVCLLISAGLALFIQETIIKIYKKIKNTFFK